MISIYFLEKFGLSHTNAKSISDAGFTLLDFFVLDNKNLYSQLLTNSKREKVFAAIDSWLNQEQILMDIFDDVIMLNATDNRVPKRAFQLEESILNLRNIMKSRYNEEDEISFTDRKIEKNIDEYTKLLSNTNEVVIWETFIYFLKNISLNIINISNEKISIDGINQLKSLNLIFEENEILYLNINNFVKKEVFIKYFDIDVNRIPKFEKVVSKMTIDDFLNVDFKDKDFFIQRINGSTLQEIATKYGLTKERVRQKLQKIEKNLPKLRELEKYNTLFQEYNISKEVFINIFNKDERIYNLMSCLYSKGEKNIIDEILNGEYPQKSKDYILNVMNKVKIGEEVKIATRENALIEVMKENKDLQKYISKEDLVILYSEYVKDYPKLKIVNERSLFNIADKDKNIIKSIFKGYRIYETDLSEEIIEKLKHIIIVLPPGNYSMDYIFNHNKDFMEEINIMDGSELHNLFLRHEILVENMVLGRNPQFSLGISSKEEFIFQEMISFHGRDLDEFVDYININFGLLKTSFKAYLSVEFPEYISNKKILIDSEDYSEIKKLMEGLLTEKIYIPEDFNKIITDNTSIKTVSHVLINQLGFRVRGSLIVDKKYISCKDAFISIILSEKIFSPESEKIFKTNDFFTAIYSLEREFKILKIGENRYLNTSVLKARGYDFSKFKSFITEVEKTIQNNEYFTIISLLNDGFEHEILEDGFDLVTLDRLISISQVLKSVNSSFPTLYYKGAKKFVNDFLLDLLLEYGSINVEDFTDDINDKYGLNLDEENVRYRLQQEEVFYSKELNKMYIYKNDYLDEVYGK
ncbi:hypothetical protein [Granulicatella sp.]